MDENSLRFKNPNESQHCFEEEFELANLENMNFPLRNYFDWFDPDKDRLLASLRDYIRCRREGIPVLKLEKPLYLKHKYLWCTKNLRDTHNRIHFDDNLMKKIVQYILCDSIMYQELSVDYWISWLVHVDWLVAWIKSYNASSVFCPREVRQDKKIELPIPLSKNSLLDKDFRLMNLLNPMKIDLI